MKTKLLVLVLLAGGSMFAQTRFSFGVNIGGRAPGYYAAVRPAYPGPGYVWVDGYWDRNYGRNVWVAGYWTRPAPRYEERYERDRDRDHDRDRDRRYGNGFRGR